MYMIDFFKDSKDLIWIIWWIISIILFIWGILYWIFKIILKDKIKIKSFWLKLEWWKNNQCFYFKNLKKLILTKEILKENFPWSLLYSGYNFPKFEVLIQNNSDKSYVIENFSIKIDNIYNSDTPLIWLSFSWNEIWNKNELKWKYWNLFFDFTNLWINKITNFKIIEIIAYNQNEEEIVLCLRTKKEKYDILSWKTEKIEIELKDKSCNYNFSKLVFNIKLENNWKVVNHQLLYTLWKWNYNHLFHDSVNWFYMIPPEIMWWWFYSYDVWKFLIPTSLWFNKLKWKKLSYPLKRFIKTKNIDNFSFYLGVDYPCKISIDLIFDFWDKKIIKNILIDFNFPISFDLKKYKKDSNVLLLK